MKLRRLFSPALAFLLCPCILFPLTFEPKGLISLWGVGGFQSSSRPQLGLRYIPEFSLAVKPSASATLDAEFSAHAFGTALFEKRGIIRTEGDIKPYRAWLRFSLTQFEARIGLQKINFGSAALLRPLMWFDTLDPRDPLQLTDGVNALLLRYYFVNNTNIWVWGLFGNEKTKGWEAFPTQEDTIEYGGRLEIPLVSGELAATYHHRRADIGKPPLLTPTPGANSAPENRYALDGKWDLGIGLWFEGALIRQESALLPFPWQRALNAGFDYTFDIGNGLYVLGEHYNLARTREAFASGDAVDFSALLIRYPLSLLDEITGILYYDWKTRDPYRFISWQRTFDKWRFIVIGFWNPEKFLIYPASSGKNPFSGKGFQVTIIFDY